jgi:hypothetical protein
MVISEDTVHKVTRGSIFSVALHPSEMRTLVAAGAKSGQIGLWDLVSYFLKILSLPYVNRLKENSLQTFIINKCLEVCSFMLYDSKF